MTDKQSKVWYRTPVQFLAVGFGSGLAPVAPGTFGTLPALLLWVPLSHLHWSTYLGVIVLLTLAGIWICEQASIFSGVDDHGSIVWDEIVGYLIAVFAIPFSLTAMALAFVLFRVFDILKPWPVSWADSKIKGGLGVMLDDVLAGLYSCVILHMLYWQFPALLQTV